MTYRSSFAKLGSKENPVRLGQYEMEDLRKMLEEGDAEYDKLIAEENPDRAAEVREWWRARIFARWPDLYDHCHVEYGPNENDYWIDQTRAWFERIYKPEAEGGTKVLEE